jgi:RecA/RadA recombinase
MRKINFNILQSISEVAIKIEKSELQITNTNNSDVCLKRLAKYMQLTERQTLLFVAIFATQNERFSDTNVKGISDFLKKSFFDILRIKKDFDVLLEKRYIFESEYFNNRKRRRSFSRTEFEVNEEVLLSIYDNTPIKEAEKRDILDVYGFVQAVSNLIVDRSQERMETYLLLKEMEKLESINASLPMLQQIMLLNIDAEERLFYYEICNDMLCESYTNVQRTLSDIYDFPRERFIKARLYKQNKSKLHEMDLVSNMESTFMNEFRMCLSNRGMELFLQENADVLLDKQKSKDVILPTAIQSKKLYFEPNMQQQIDFLKQSLTSEQYANLTERLHQNALPTGINCIFYGAPGTGKTETAMQIAKSTGRSVFVVDISNTKSMWFGESEKTIREIFNRYRTTCKMNDTKPILLFNEADAVFGKRKDVNASNVAQTENAIQNIILEEMEKMEGILIATTNLAENLDSAFDRRFLFKIRFDKPTVNAKMNIWKDRLPWLDEETARNLANKFDFSGGEIENIVRKAITHEVLTGSRPDSFELTDLCQKERIQHNNQRKAVGFNVI